MLYPQHADETLSKAIVVAEKESQWAEVLRQEQVKVRKEKKGGSACVSTSCCCANLGIAAGP